MRVALKAVVPAAGLGTRMLPATKSQPKEMLPVVDRPAIQWVVEEAVAGGCDEVVVVTGPTKRAIEAHFGPSPELKDRLRRSGNEEALRAVEAIEALGKRVRFVEQTEPLGLGHAVLTAREAVGDSPFAVLLGDDILVDGVPATGQLVAAHRAHGASVLCVQEVPLAETRRYGVIRGEPFDAEPRLSRVADMVEKPDPAAAPSRLAAVGRYVFEPEVFDELAATRPDARGEIQLTDAIRALARRRRVLALPFGGTRYDVGSIPGWLAANAALGAR